MKDPRIDGRERRILARLTFNCRLTCKQRMVASKYDLGSIFSNTGPRLEGRGLSLPTRGGGSGWGEISRLSHTPDQSCVEKKPPVQSSVARTRSSNASSSS